MNIAKQIWVWIGSTAEKGGEFIPSYIDPTTGFMIPFIAHSEERYKELLEIAKAYETDVGITLTIKIYVLLGDMLDGKNCPTSERVVDSTQKTENEKEATESHTLG